MSFLWFVGLSYQPIPVLGSPYIATTVHGIHVMPPNHLLKFAKILKYNMKKKKNLSFFIFPLILYFVAFWFCGETNRKIGGHGLWVVSGLF